MSKKALDLIASMAKAEIESVDTQFIAPCLQNGRLKIMINGIVKTLRPYPRDFSGWGRFRYAGGKTAVFEDEPMEYEREEYLQSLPSMRFRLCFGDAGTWIAFPYNMSDAKQRFGHCDPTVIRLVEGASRFGSVVAKYDGATWWFEKHDGSDDMAIIEQMNMEFERRRRASGLNIPNLTPEALKAYDMAQNPTPIAGIKLPETDEDRIREALRQGGGELISFTDRGDRWVVEWMTSKKERHSSAITKDNMTVMSAGICLSGQDNKFDLHTLVGVVEKRNDYDDDDDW